MAYKTIASIYPIAMSLDRPAYNGYFRMPGAKSTDEPVLFRVNDHVQTETLPWIMAPQGASRQSQQRALIHCEDIANDLVKHWARGLPDQDEFAHPGIWIVRDSIPVFNEDGSIAVDAMGRQEFRPATQEEKDEMFAEDLLREKMAQEAWAEKCIILGDSLEAQMKVTGRMDRRVIPQFCKVLCKAYGREREWLQNLKDGDRKKCHFCKSIMEKDAIVCLHCSREQPAISTPAPQPIPAQKKQEDDTELVGAGTTGNGTPAQQASTPKFVRK